MNWTMNPHSELELTGSVYQIWLHLTEFTYCA